MIAIIPKELKSDLLLRMGGGGSVTATQLNLEDRVLWHSLLTSYSWLRLSP